MNNNNNLKIEDIKKNKILSLFKLYLLNKVELIV